MKFLLKLVFLKLFNIEVLPIGEKTFSKIISKTLLQKRSGGGSYGEYYQISRSKGIKLLYSSFITFEDALKSELYKDAQAEAKLMREAKTRYSNIPQCFGVKVIKMDTTYRIGIIMQHLGTQKAVTHPVAENDDFKNELVNRLRQVGIIHDDLHYNNIMLYKEDWWVIDFSPEFITIEPI